MISSDLKRLEVFRINRYSKFIIDIIYQYLYIHLKGVHNKFSRLLVRNMILDLSKNNPMGEMSMSVGSLSSL
jgi:hypothetical protein